MTTALGGAKSQLPAPACERQSEISGTVTLHRVFRRCLATATGRIMDRPYSMLFISRRNSARSVMAEAVVNHLGKGKFREIGRAHV